MRKPKWLAKSLMILTGMSLLILGLRVDAYAKNLTFTLDTPYYRQNETIAIAKQLKALGIDVKLKMLWFTQFSNCV